MDQLCVRCTRHALRSSASRSHAGRAAARPFSNSSRCAVFDLSKVLSGDSSPSKPASKPSSQVSAQTSNSTSGPPKVLVRKVTHDGPQDNSRVLSRTRPAQSDSSNQRVFSKPFQSPSSAPTSQVLRRSSTPRSGPPRGSGPPRSRGGGRGGFGARGGARGRGGGYGGSMRSRSGGGSPEEDAIADAIKDENRARRRDADKEQRESDELAFEQYEADRYNANLNNGLPTEPIPYIPAEQTMEELRKDWPDTPLTPAGLAEGVIQKLNFLARDLPHGYWTPRQIAERLVDGGLVKFEDEEHKAKVMHYAEIYLEERNKHEKSFLASLKAPQEGQSSLEPWTKTGFVSVAGKEEGTQSVIAASVRGVYPDLPTGQRPLYAGIARQLRNNETYGVDDSNRLLGRVQALVETVQRQAAQQRAAGQEQQQAQ